VDQATHKRYLDYLERHSYFGRSAQPVSMTDFEALDREQLELDAKDERRDDEEEARYEELSKLLFRD
jgi:hypothetical protein